jgi:hypothetical protein
MQHGINGLVLSSVLQATENIAMLRIKNVGKCVTYSLCTPKPEYRLFEIKAFGIL